MCGTKFGLSSRADLTDDGMASGIGSNVLSDVAASIAQNRIKLAFSVERRVNISLATARHTLS